jgi:hypothetical protein
MPGHIGTSIAINSGLVLGHPDPLAMSSEAVAAIRERMSSRGVALDQVSDEQIRQLVKQQGINFRDHAPMSAAEAATVILDGVKAERWRILVGTDAEALDRLVRESPETAYDSDFLERMRQQPGVNWQLS